MLKYGSCATKGTAGGRCRTVASCARPGPQRAVTISTECANTAARFDKICLLSFTEPRISRCNRQLLEWIFAHLLGFRVQAPEHLVHINNRVVDHALPRPDL